MLLGTAGLCLLIVPGALAAPADDTAAAFVGGEQCAECHEDMEDSLVGTAHGSSFFGEMEGHTCESCHGAGSLHADDPENYSMRVTDLTAEEQSATCQGCHSGREQFFWTGGEHESRGLSCLSCHSVHSPKSMTAQLQVETTEEQCFSCHKNVRAEGWKRSHHPVREGRLGCNDCHNPHGSTTEAMMREASVNEQCYTCHAEKRGPFLWEHPPVRENCLSCHETHGSNHTKLKRTEVPYLCQRCHSNTRHPGTLYDGSRVVGGDGESNRLINRSCLNCHNAIHGSNHPSSPYLSH
jgi:DmsE family decaheme c-type cytochrome